ncbi:thiol-disulfide oxidoreductase DCC family protein [Hymenobacter sp. BT175]|uniref:thiol-disulfide oxidoreductase DCC family protein n=1 Tax=Hymenobacter translucens TaxID=2886507 RepID=UPI001D0DF442|nr:thiol-disulfide oxidoreductase DCC family protein [Hymenobacter translucens]MCC2547187.1 thiol-disulfide oxidoreductase DCC family protein [Hymenobacter translucens]
MTSTPATILFDGVCNLCNGFVQFVINRDPHGRFRFAALQSDAGQELLRAHGASAAVVAPETIMLVDQGRVYSHSAAVLRILRGLSGPWPLMSAAVVVPAFIRDAVYRFVARHRYQWFGREESCMLPTPELARRFL